MFCNVDGCTKQATHLRIMEIDKDRRIKFNLCTECNKINWKYLLESTVEKIAQDAKEAHKEARNHLDTTFVREKAFREGR